MVVNRSGGSDSNGSPVAGVGVGVVVVVVVTDGCFGSCSSTVNGTASTSGPDPQNLRESGPSRVRTDTGTTGSDLSTRKDIGAPLGL